MKVVYCPCSCNCPKPPFPPVPSIPTIRQVEITGTVACMSIYAIVVTLSVTRSGTGHIDNYY